MHGDPGLPVGQRVRLVIVPRRAANLKPETPSFGRIPLGAMAFGGRFVLQRSGLPDGYVSQMLQAADQSVVRPRELPWLEGLRDPHVSAR